MTRQPGSGLLILDKPAGLTSHDCVARLRRLLKENRVGHAGTLDPLASGVLLILVGDTTAHQAQYMGLEKEYWLRAEFGRRTESGDRDGEPLVTSPYAPVSAEKLRRLLEAFEGEHWQVPPSISALKHRGRPLYKWTRLGFDIEPAPRLVRVRRFELLNMSGPFWEARVVCSKGTYIRALVQDVARQVGTGAVLDRLVRERIGPYRRHAARTLSQVADMINEDAGLLLHA